MREDEDRPRPKTTHAIGQDLSLLSVEEIDERISALKDEIERLASDRIRKVASKSAANAFFKL